MEDTILISQCCNKEVSEDYKQSPYDKNEDIDIYVCSKCKRECLVNEVCAYCLGTGEESLDEDDGEGHLMKGVGSKKCIHCKNI